MTIKEVSKNTFYVKIDKNDIPEYMYYKSTNLYSILEWCNSLFKAYPNINSFKGWLAC